jgi:hypothetical protein
MTETLETMNLEANIEEMKSTADHQEVPYEEAMVETIRVLED